MRTLLALLLTGCTVATGVAPTSDATPDVSSVEAAAAVVDLPDAADEHTAPDADDGALPCCPNIRAPYADSQGNCSACRWCDDAAHSPCLRDH